MVALTRLDIPTPLRDVTVTVGGRRRHVLLKLESAHPLGSIKARTAAALLDRLSSFGTLAPGMTIVESSSGNLGVALAALGRARGMQVRVVVDPKTTGANLAAIEAAGGSLEMVHEADATGGYLSARLKRVQELLDEIDGSAWTNQYTSPANPEAHYYGTGLEIVRSVPTAGAVFVACSTGGTYAGVRARVRASGLPIKVIPVDVPGSAALHEAAGKRLLTGIGSSVPSAFVSPADAQTAHFVDDLDAIAACRALDALGISVGGSSGAAFCAAVDWFEGHAEADTAVVICPDAGAGYDFSDAWLHAQGVTDPLPARWSSLDLDLPGASGTPSLFPITSLDLIPH